MREFTCCFTGHREILAQEEPLIAQRTEVYVRRLIEQGVKYFGVGGALGYDTLAARLLFTLRRDEFSHIKIILVYPFAGYTKHWSPEQKAVYHRLFACYDKTVCVSQYATKGAYLQRNRHLVDFSQYCIAYCTKSTGGTAYTLRYAKSRGLDIKNVANPLQ